MSDHERAATWNRIQGSISHMPSTILTQSPYLHASPNHIKKTFLSRDYAIALLCVLLLSSTTSVAAAAEDSLPTSVLYPIKINVTEPLQTLIKTTPESRIDWEIERTNRRLEETRQLITTQELTPQIATELAQRIQNHTNTAQSEIQELSQSDSVQGTVLSLSLIETIERKQEEITIASTQSSLETNSFTTSINTAQDIALADEITPAVVVLNSAHQAQQSTQDLITTIAAHTPESVNPTIASEAKIEVQNNKDILVYTLVMNDIQEKIAELKSIVPAPEINTELKSETLIKVEPSTLIAVDTTSTASLDTATKTNDTVSIPAALPASITPTANTDPTVSSQPVVSDTGSSSPITDLNAQPVTLPRIQNTPTEELRAIIAQFELLQSVSQPTELDIATARSLRQKAETLISQLESKTKQEADTANVTTTSPEISTNLSDIPLETIRVPVYSEIVHTIKSELSTSIPPVSAQPTSVPAATSTQIFP